MVDFDGVACCALSLCFRCLVRMGVAIDADGHNLLLLNLFLPHHERLNFLSKRQKRPT